MALWRLSWKEFRSRPLRTLLTLSSIVIGVGAVVAVGLAIENTRAAQRSMLQSVAGRASLEIQAEGGSSFGQELLSKVRELPDIQLAAEPYVALACVLWERKEPQDSVLGSGCDVGCEVP